jgi:hypothetical protein
LSALPLLLACSPTEVELIPAARRSDGGTGSDARLEVSTVLEGAPANARDYFPEDTSGDRTGEPAAPRIVYPSDETMLPTNLEHLLAQWVAGEDLDLFELGFDSSEARVRYYTTAREVAPDVDTFRKLARVHAGGALQIRVRGVRRDDRETVFRSPTITLLFASGPVLGALYYWSTGAGGVMRAHVSAASATKFYPDPAGADHDKCAGCHSVSRDGRRLAVGYDGERLREVTIPGREVILPSEPNMPMDPMAMLDPMAMPPEPPKPADIPYGWGTFSPDGTRLLYAHKGELRLLDADSGQELAKVELPGELRATHPDWSPDGRYVALSYGSSDKGDKNKEVRGSSLARLPVLDDGTFGAPEVLLESSGPEDTLFFPVHSPDSQWIAFARATGKSKDNASAELFLLHADGGEPVVLERLNHRVRDEDGVQDVGNTMPTWAPATGNGVFWLAFSSQRDYGEQLRGVARDQLWAAAIDPEAIRTDDEASYAAFWMPFQDLADNNHRAFWALAPEDECPSTMELCDGLDNDCDGLVDEACCEATTEVCGDGEDNDCDGLPDERCGCDDRDLCDNLVDDDCDQSVDEDCVF